MSQNLSQSKKKILFDRKLLKARRNKVASNIDDYDFLFNEVAANLRYRFSLVKKQLPDGLFIGDVKGKFSDSLEHNLGVHNIIRADLAEAFEPNIVLDEESLPFKSESFDVVLSLLTMQWVNDISKTLQEIKRVLRPNSLFIGAMLGGVTLRELRKSLMQAELNLIGESSSRVIPFVDSYDMSQLMLRAGFDVPVVDSEIITVEYPNVNKLIDDIKGMGATNISNGRVKKLSPKNLFAETDKIYKKNYADDKGFIPASFDIVYFTGWSRG